MSTNRLILIAIGGILTAAICFGVAVGVGGRSALNHLGDLGDFDIGNWDQPRCIADGNGQDVTRQIPWDGSDRVEIGMPTDVHYQARRGRPAGDQGRRPAIVNLVRLDDGKAASASAAACAYQ